MLGIDACGVRGLEVKVWVASLVLAPLELRVAAGGVLVPSEVAA